MTKNLISQLTSIRGEMLDLERRHIATVGSSHSNYADSQRNLLHYLALVKISGDDARLIAFAGFEQGRMRGHDVPALRFGRLMASLAMLLEDRPNGAIVADGDGRRGLCRRLRTRSNRFTKVTCNESDNQEPRCGHRETRGLVRTRRSRRPGRYPQGNLKASMVNAFQPRIS